MWQDNIKQMRLLGLILVFFIAYTCLYSQSIYDQLNHTNFRKHKAFTETINPHEFNTKLLNACIFFATNEIRVKKRLSSLNYHPLLENASTIHSDDMVNMNFFSHTNPRNNTRKEPEDRAKEVGIKNPHIAENIIEGFVIRYKPGKPVSVSEPGIFIDPKTNKPLEVHTYLSLTDEILKMWMNSSGHKKNILSDKAFELGCGVAFYIMNDFNEMPAVKATQCFQWFEPVTTTK